MPATRPAHQILFAIAPPTDAVATGGEPALRASKDPAGWLVPMAAPAYPMVRSRRSAGASLPTMNPMGNAPTLVELDSRRRAALGRLAHHDRYLVTEEPDGTLIFTPAVVMTDLEARLLRNNPKLVEALEAKMAHPERLVRRPLSSRGHASTCTYQ